VLLSVGAAEPPGNNGGFLRFLGVTRELIRQAKKDRRRTR